MNILFDELPSYVECDGSMFQINTDFRVWIKIDILMSDISLNKSDAIIQALMLCYKDLPSNIEIAVNKMFEFYVGNRIDNKKSGNGKHKKPTHSFKYDGEYIFAAFYQQYGIDLISVNMHWWKFKALFAALSEDTQFIKIVQYRSMDIGKIKDKEQKKFYQKMKQLYRLPNLRSESDMLDEMAVLF